MTNIIQLRNAYQAGTLPKPYFLGAVYALTQSLVDFQDALEGTQIREIIVGTDGLRIRTVDHDLELMFYPEEANSLVTGILAFGDAERLERRALLAAAHQSQVILDIGANVGWYSLHFARVAGEARIYAFEPAARIHARLLVNLALNGITGVVTEQLALQDQEGTDTLYFHPAETGASSVRDNRGFTGVQPEEIRCTTLDLYCSRQGIRPDLIKCDVEGGELSVVRAALATLQECQPVVFLELLRKWSANFGYHPNEVLEIMQELRYQAWAIESSGLHPCTEITGDTVATNFLFTCEGKHDALIQQLARL